jgi:predicted nucleic acid-binding protein
LRCLEIIFENKDISLIASRWTKDETTKVIIRKTREMAEKEKIPNREYDGWFTDAYIFIEELFTDKRLGNVDFEVRSIKDDFSAEKLLIEVGKKAGFGKYTDALHCIIMNIFNIGYILTFDTNDFSAFEKKMGIRSINPDDIEDFIQNIS